MTWLPPKDYPNLSGASLIAVDCETKDPHLLEKGPGGVRNDGHIIGVSVAVEGFKGYFPVRHEGGGNLDLDATFKWLRDTLGSNQPKVGANIIYDLEWFRFEGIPVNGPKYDVQIAEPLLNEDLVTYKLDALAERYLGKHKTPELFVQEAIRMGIKEKDATGNIWRMHSMFVGPYAEDDADLTLQIFNLQKPKLIEEGLWNVFELETKLVDVLLAMRFKGIPVDVNKAEQVCDKLLTEQKITEKRLQSLANDNNLDIWSGPSLAQACATLGILYPTTAKGNPSFEGDWLNAQDHEFFKGVVHARRLDRMGGIFIKKKILETHVNGRIYPTFRQVKNDDGGTKSGRFASANPNMQQIPARDPVLAPLLRGLFVPESGCQWGVFDYSQQEPRVTVHYACISGFKGADEAKKRYVENPDTDYHQMVADMAGIPRKQAKNLNLGLAYGMGIKKMSQELGLSLDETKELYAKYHTSVPFIKILGDKCMRVAQERGYIRTILGRRRHFNLFGPPKYKPGIVPLVKEDAIKQFGLPVTRYFVHKAMNALIQGSSADMIKKAMVDAYAVGYVLPLTIHDELDATDIQSEKQVNEIRDILINAIKLEVPLKVDVELGPSWGEVK